MADLLDGIARYLQTQGLVTYDPDGTGGDCFIDFLPPAPDEAVVLSAYGLGEPDPLSDDDETGLQVRVRGGPDPRLSRRRAMAIYSALHGLSGVALPDGTWLILAVALQTPAPLGIDSSGRHEHSVNFRLNITNSTANRG